MLRGKKYKHLLSELRRRVADKIDHEIESVSISNDIMIDSEREKAKPKNIKKF